MAALADAGVTVIGVTIACCGFGSLITAPPGVVVPAIGPTVGGTVVVVATARACPAGIVGMILPVARMRCCSIKRRWSACVMS